jgi:hypothetical protein
MFKFTGVISFEGSYGELHRRDTKLMFFSDDAVLPKGTTPINSKIPKNWYRLCSDSVWL